MDKKNDFEIESLGECLIDSPLKGIKFTSEDDHVLYHSDLDQNLLHIKKLI